MKRLNKLYDWLVYIFHEAHKNRGRYNGMTGLKESYYDSVEDAVDKLIGTIGVQTRHSEISF